MDEEEIRYHAERLICEWLDSFEYSFIYEDEELEECEEGDWKAIHDAIRSSVIDIKFTGSKED